MKGYVGNIEEITLKNKYFRKVVFTGTQMQLVVMCLKPNEAIGDEVHHGTDQFFRIEKGVARVIFNEKEKHTVKAGGAIVVPAETYHNIINASKTKSLQLYTIYAPPHHPDKTVHKTKKDAEQHS